MIRVLFLITEFQPGGAEKALYDIVRRLDRDRFDPRVACLDGPGYYSDKYSSLGLPVHHLGLASPPGRCLPAFALAAARTVLRLAALLRRHRIQVLQSFLFHANMVGRCAGALARTPVVLGAVRTAEPRHLHTLFDGLTFWLTDAELCVSRDVWSFQARRAGLAPGRLLVVPQGVDPEEHHVPAAPFAIGPPQSVQRRQSERARLHLPHHRPVFAFVGRLDPAKALDDLLSAFSHVAASHPAPVLAIGGDGPLRRWLRSEILRMGLGERVRLLGWLDDPRGLYAAADCLVLSSVVEGMPRVVLEAMAAGLPVVSTDAPGCRELVLHGETGLLSPRRRPEQLAAHMRSLLEDPGRAARMGVSGRRRALSAFSLDEIVRRYERIYLQFLRPEASAPTS